MWINIFPDKSVTKKPAETRMGSGRQPRWVAVVKPGRVMFELRRVPESLAREAMKRAQHKLPIKTKFISRTGSSRMPGKAAELRELPDDELLVRVDAAKEELFNLRFQLATGQLDNPTAHREVRREVARIATVLRQREIEAELDAIAAAREAASEEEQ